MERSSHSVAIAADVMRSPTRTRPITHGLYGSVIRPRIRGTGAVLGSAERFDESCEVSTSFGLKPRDQRVVPPLGIGNTAVVRLVMFACPFVEGVVCLAALGDACEGAAATMDHVSGGRKRELEQQQAA